MVKEEVIQKSKGRGEMRGRGGPQRGGRGGRGMHSTINMQGLNSLTMCSKHSLYAIKLIGTRHG